MGGEQRSPPNVPLPRDPDGEARGAGRASAEAHHRGRLHSRAGALRAGSSPACTVGQGYEASLSFL